MDMKKVAPVAVLMLVVGLVVGYTVKINTTSIKQGATIVDSQGLVPEETTPESKEFSLKVEEFLNTHKTFDEKEYQLFLESIDKKIVGQKVVEAQKALDDAIAIDLGYDQTIGSPGEKPDAYSHWKFKCHEQFTWHGVTTQYDVYSNTNDTGHTGGTGWSLDISCLWNSGRAGPFD
jgi:hypothetical protein